MPRKAAIVGLLILLPLLLALLVPSALSENKTSLNKARWGVRGKINLAPGLLRPKTLGWATILLEEVNGTLRRQTTAGYDGSFHFDKVSEGRYQIVVYVRGFREVRHTVEITRRFADPQGKVSVNIDLNERHRLTPRERAERRFISVDELAVPEEARKEYERARRAMMKGDAEEMKRHLEKAIELAPNFVQALNDLGTYYHRTRHFGKAIALFRQALKVDPGAFAPQVNLT